MAGIADRDIHLRVIVDEDSKGADRAAAGLDHVGRSADKAGHSMRGLSDDAKVLKSEIDKTTHSIAALERQMVLTGDRTLRRRISSERSWLAELKRIAKSSPNFDLIPGAGAEGGFANIGDMLGKIPTRWNMIGGAISAAVGPGPIAPTLGATASGLLAGALGTAGVAGAIASTLREPKVLTALAQFGDSIADEFFRSGPALADTVVHAMTILDSAFKQMKLPEVFEKMGPIITTIINGVGRLGINLMPGLNKAFDRMGPLADAAAEGMADLGSALGTFFDQITASPGAVMGLEFAFNALNGTIVLTGEFLHMLSAIFEKMVNTFNAMPFFRSIPILGSGLRDLQIATHDSGVEIDGWSASMFKAAEAGKSWALQLDEANDALENIQNQLSGYINDQLSFDKAVTKVQEGWFEITKAIQENGTSLAANSEHGLANRDMMLERIENLDAMRQAEIKLTGDVVGANTAYDAQIKALIELGVKAGFSRKQLEELAKNYYVNIVFQAELSRSLAPYAHLIPGYGSQVREFASGGTTPSGEVFKVGEAGPEYLFSSKQHYVANRQMMSGSGGMGAGGGGGTRVVIDVTGGDEDLKRLIRKWVRIDGPQVIGIS